MNEAGALALPTASKAIDGDGSEKWVYAGTACRTRTVTI